MLPAELRSYVYPSSSKLHNSWLQLQVLFGWIYIKVFPYDTTFEQMQEWEPDGFFISNGPGDPDPLHSAQKVAQKIIEHNLPLFGICLGHQIIALANGIPTYKMFNGHRGINHPVINLTTGKGEITSQNHGFALIFEAKMRLFTITCARPPYVFRIGGVHFFEIFMCRSWRLKKEALERGLGRRFGVGKRSQNRFLRAA